MYDEADCESTDGDQAENKSNSIHRFTHLIIYLSHLLILIFKALTSGTIPSFLDVAMNFGDDEINIDTFLRQMNNRKEKIVQAGDDTWKMFNVFTRQYANKDSLFVNDFYEGDRNVTDSLRMELKQDDWKLLILRKKN
jgi:hypothetical protein